MTLLSINQDIASLYTSEAYDPSALTALLDKRAALEKKLTVSKGSSAIKSVAIQNIDLKCLFSFMKPEDILFDYAKVRLWDFESFKQTGEKYVVFIVRPKSGEIFLRDLGDSKKIDGTIKAFYSNLDGLIAERATDFSKTEMIISPLLNLSKKLLPPIGGSSKLTRYIICPDDKLHLLPFEILLEESQQVLYLAAARDIFNERSVKTSSKNAVIFADPAFDETKPPEAFSERNSASEAFSFRGIMAIEEKPKVGEATLQFWFSPLPDTRKEAREIGKILTDGLGLNVSIKLGAEASEKNLYLTKSPKVLHIATHGELSGKIEKTAVEITQQDLFATFISSAVFPSESFRESFLALAGANTSLRMGFGNGIMTPGKLFGLDLTGTDLVVLSGCNTGIGDTEAVEGLFGLKRSFMVSGAKSVIASFWPVSSSKTTEFMDIFYRQLVKTKSATEAMMNAKSLIKKKYENPFIWGAFSLTGSLTW